MKLVLEEPESSALRGYLQGRPERTSSALAFVEVIRAARRRSEATVDRAMRVLEQTDLLALDEPLLRSASEIGGPLLRSLDAIHLASAQTLADNLEALVTYDERLTHAAAALGIPTANPK